MFSMQLFASGKIFNKFTVELIGKQIDNKTFQLDNGQSFTSFRVEGGFKTNINKYGTYFCSVNTRRNEIGELDNSDFICELKDQQNDKFWVLGKRLEGTEAEVAAGKYEIIDGNGFWKDKIGIECLYGIEFVDSYYFSSQKCSK